MIELWGTPLYSQRIASRSISAENPRGEVGQGGKALNGRKGEPCLPNLRDGQVYTFAEMAGPGVIRHIWVTPEKRNPDVLRNLILRFYWNEQSQASVEAPLGDFFGVSHGATCHFESGFLTNAEGRAFNSYFPMPFSTSARLTISNESGRDAGMFFYEVDYTAGDDITIETPHFHAQFRRVANTTMYEDYVILDGVVGKGRYLGANVGIVDRYAKCDCWWGEGEVKIYIDGDDPYPTICGTGSEDYAGAAWGIGRFHAREFGAPFVEGKHISFYRFHGHDPVYFSRDLKVTIQQIGNDGSVTPLKPGERPAMDPFIKAGLYKKDYPGGNFERVDDVCSTAYWYQTLPTHPFPEFPRKALRSLELVSERTQDPGAAAGPQSDP
jgi:hypothetical protein